MDRVNAMKTAYNRAEEEDAELLNRIHDAKMRLFEIDKKMSGSEAKDEVGESGPPSPGSRMYVGFRALSTTYGPTANHEKAVEAGKGELQVVKQELNAFINSEMQQLERALEAIGAPPIEN